MYTSPLSLKHAVTDNNSTFTKKTLLALSLAAVIGTHSQAAELVSLDKNFEGQLSGNYGLILKDQDYTDINLISVKNTQFVNMGIVEGVDAAAYGNGGLWIDGATFEGDPISKIEVIGIVQKGELEGVIPYYGIKIEHNSPIKAKEILVDTVTTEAPFNAARGFYTRSKVGYEVIKIKNIEGAAGAVGLDVVASLKPLEEGVGVIEISNVKGKLATGAAISGASSGTLLSVHDVTSTGVPESYYSYSAIGIEVDREIDFDQIDVKDIRSEHDNAYGIYLSHIEDFSTNKLIINGIHGNKSYGFHVLQGKGRTINTDEVHLLNIGDQDSSHSVAINVDGNIWNGRLLEIQGVHTSNEGFAAGIVNRPASYTGTSSEAARSLMDFGEINIKQVFGGKSFGINSSSEDKPNFVSIVSDRVEIEDIKGSESAFGIYADLASTLNVGVLTVRDIDADFSAAVDAENQASLNVGIAEINPSNWESYEGGYGTDFSAEPLSVKSFAIRAVSGSKVEMATENGHSAQIYGTVVAGRGVEDSEIAGGIVSIGCTDSTVDIVGDVFAGNDGVVNLTLGKDSTLEGQVDDYHELDTVESGSTFRNSAFMTSDGDELPVTEAGSVNLSLNGGTWIARGQSFVRNVTFGSEGGFIDLTKNVNSSVSIANLSGKGEFDMLLGAYSDTETIESDMLYIQNVADGSSFTINAHLDDSVKSLDDLKNLRFATVGQVEGGHRDSLFTVRVADEGFKDWNFTVERTDYVVGDEENDRYNGSDNGSESYKPGSDSVDEIFGGQQTSELQTDTEMNRTTSEGAQNYILASAQQASDSTISDAGQAVIATARGLYYNAVEIDRFNQRYGDRRYDEKNGSLWIRVRHDRWGTDAGVGDFRSRNTTYQMGYDYTRSVENGKMIYGAAFDFMDGDTDYDSIHGTGETQRWAGSVYATYMHDKGSYLDMIGKVGRLSNEYSVSLDSGAVVSADYMNWMAGLSLEAGHQFTGEHTRWFTEPQIQAQYVFVSDNDYSNGQTKIEQDSIHSFITRLGFRVGRWLDDDRNASVYAKADVLREWAGDQAIHVSDKTTAAGGETFDISNHGTWFDVGLGFQTPIGKSFYAYGDAEYRFGNDLDQTWTFNFGGKFVF